MSVARFIADQRTNYRVPHTITCLLLGVSLAWFYKWLDRPPTSRQQRRADVDAAVAAMFDDAKGLHGSPRLHADLRDAGWMITERTVADSMRRQGLIARKAKHRRGTTKQDRSAPKFPDLLKRDFTASAPNLKWCGDITEIPTGEREAVPGHGDRPVLPPAARGGDQSALRRGVVRAGDQDRRRGPRRPVHDQQCGVPHRPRIDLYRPIVHPGLF